MDDTFKRKMCERGLIIKGGVGVVKTEKGIFFCFFILKKNVDDIMRIMKILQNSGVLINLVSKTVNSKIKRMRRRISWKVIKKFVCLYDKKNVN